MSGRGVLPGFGLTLGYTLGYLGLLVVLPLSALVAQASRLGPLGVLRVVLEPRSVAALKLSLAASLAAAATNAAAGVLVSWVLVRYRFKGRSFVDALIDLPLALPTAVAGIAFTALYAPTGWIGSPLARLGVEVAFKPVGVYVALIFVGFPLAVRTVQPVLLDLDPVHEEAAAVLGATPWQTFQRVILPAIFPSVLTGFGLSFARAVGEYGSVVFISGNLPFKTEIAPLLIVTKLEEYDYGSATALALVMLSVSFPVLLALSLLQHRRKGART